MPVNHSGNRRKLLRTAVLAAAGLALPACVYKVDVQQGNKLENDDIDRIQPGMSRNQVRFLLGTPVASDIFHENRWDYIYYFKRGKSDLPQRRWIIVWFDGDVVKQVQKDVITQPS